jgi:hypothetical protein
MLIMLDGKRQHTPTAKTACPQAQCANIHAQNFVFCILSRMEFWPACVFHSLTKIPEEDKDMWHMCFAAHHHLFPVLVPF